MDLPRTPRILVSLATVVLLASGSPSGAAVRQPRPAVAPRHVLFMCPHGAAKSVLASAYFQRRAKERGLNVIVTSAGTEPDATVAPAVAAHLARQGYPSPTTAPRKATDDDLAKADLVIALGCDMSGLSKPSCTLVRWDDIPSPSADFAAADDAIRAKVNALVDELAREGVSAKP